MTATSTFPSEFAGAPPPRVLHQGPVRDAEEVLVLTYTCDLSFVEDVCVRPARTRGARVTVVYDAEQLLAGQVTDGGPVGDYVPVPVLCRSGGAFHPKLVVIASATDATVSIGSGNATSAGWHHNAEIWTHLHLNGPTVPALVNDLANWLRRLPEQLLIDRIGRERLNAVADLLTARPIEAEPGEPVLLTNDAAPIVGQLPVFRAGVDRLEVASPFFDPPAAALARLFRLLRPSQVRLLLTRDVQCDVDGLDRVLSRVSATEVATPVGTRYHHGKAMEWWTGSAGVLLTGSANCTRAALLHAMTDPGGNCELGLLQEISEPMLASVEARSCDLDDAELRVRPDGGDDRPAASAVRVLSVRLLRDRIEITVVATAPPEHLVVELSGRSHTVPRQDSQPPMHTYVLHTQVAHDRRTAAVYADNGEFIEHALVTDVERATTRITHPSPLEELSLSALLGDEQRLNALFDALNRLADIRAGSGGRGRSSVPARRTRTEDRISSVVGPALLHLALGRDTDHHPTAVDDEVIEPTEPGKEGATSQPTATTTGPTIDGLDRQRRERLQKRIAALVERSEGWPLPAQLAVNRIVHLVTAAGLWPHSDDWSWIIHDGLLNLWCAEEDPGFVEEHASLAAIGLVALRHAQRTSESDAELAAAFDDLRGDFRAHDEWLSAATHEALDRYCGGLSGTTFGPLFIGRHIRSDLDWLLTRDPIDDKVDELADKFPTMVRSKDGRITVDTDKDPRRTVVRVLHELRDFPDTHVVVRGATGRKTHGWWNGRRLRIASPTTGGWQVETWSNLMTGIAGFTGERALPRPNSRTIVNKIDELSR